MENIFEKFDHGVLALPQGGRLLSEAQWAAHPDFEGVELKALVTGADTGGKFSCHLVRIAPGRQIGEHTHVRQAELHEVMGGSGVCVNGGSEICYECGVLSVIGEGVVHSVTAGDCGLLLFAKFIPALG